MVTEIGATGRTSHATGALRKAPVLKRCQRIAERVNRGVYTRLANDYANGGVVLFDERRMARDFGLSVDELRNVLDTTPHNTLSCWTLPRCPTKHEILTAACAIAELLDRPEEGC